MTLKKIIDNYVNKRIEVSKISENKSVNTYVAKYCNVEAEFYIDKNFINEKSFINDYKVAVASLLDIQIIYLLCNEVFSNAICDVEQGEREAVLLSLDYVDDGEALMNDSAFFTAYAIYTKIIMKEVFNEDYQKRG